MNDLATSSSAQAAAEALIDVRDIRKSYGAVHALGGVDFQLRSGEVVGLVGHNGAGKSTLMNVLSGAVQRTAGSFRYGGEDVEIWSAGRAQSGGLRCIFQELSLCANLSAAENTRIVHRQLRGFGWRGRARDLIARSLDEIFPGHGIDPNAKISELSIGFRQMVEIARAFTETDIPVRCVILDEPTSSLGHQATEQLLAFIRKAASKGIACILITHRLNEIISVCNRAVVMVDGKIVAECSTKGLSRSNLVEMMGSIEAANGHREGQTSRSFGERQIDHGGIDAADRPIQQPPARSSVLPASMATASERDYVLSSRRSKRAARSAQPMSRAIAGWKVSSVYGRSPIILPSAVSMPCRNTVSYRAQEQKIWRESGRHGSR